MLARAVHLLTCDNAPSCLESETATNSTQDCLSPPPNTPTPRSQSYFSPGQRSWIFQTKGCAQNNHAG